MFNAQVANLYLEGKSTSVLEATALRYFGIPGATAQAKDGKVIVEFPDDQEYSPLTFNYWCLAIASRENVRSEWIREYSNAHPTVCRGFKNSGGHSFMHDDLTIQTVQ